MTTQYDEFVENCKTAGVPPEQVMEVASETMGDVCPRCCHADPLRDPATEGACWVCAEFLLSEDDIEEAYRHGLRESGRVPWA